MMLLPEHCGTHLDVPRHCLPNGNDVAGIPLEQLVLPGHLLDLTHKAKGEDFLGKVYVGGCEGTQTTRNIDLAGALVGSNPGPDTRFTARTEFCLNRDKGQVPPVTSSARTGREPASDGVFRNDNRSRFTVASSPSVS